MKTLIFTLIMLCCFLSCKYGPDYTYRWKLAIVYTNGDKDTIDCQYDSFNGNECYLILKISSNGLVSSGGMEPCIVMWCGMYYKPVACGVRKYDILKSDKIPLK